MIRFDMLARNPMVKQGNESTSTVFAAALAAANVISCGWFKQH